MCTKWMELKIQSMHEKNLNKAFGGIEWGSKTVLMLMALDGLNAFMQYLHACVSVNRQKNVFESVEQRELSYLHFIR